MALAAAAPVTTHLEPKAQLQRENEELEAYNRGLRRQNARLRERLLSSSARRPQRFVEPLKVEDAAEKPESDDDASTTAGSHDGRDLLLSGDSEWSAASEPSDDAPTAKVPESASQGPSGDLEEAASEASDMVELLEEEDEEVDVTEQLLRAAPGLQQESRTTLMLRNLPKHLTRDALVAVLDNFGFSGAYDLVYLPIDFATDACIGYAFVNFRFSTEAMRFQSSFQGFKSWPAELRAEEISVAQPATWCREGLMPQFKAIFSKLRPSDVREMLVEDAAGACRRFTKSVAPWQVSVEGLTFPLAIKVMHSVAVDASCDVDWTEGAQGLLTHVERYKNSPVMHYSVPDSHKPAIFSQGVRVIFPQPTKAVKAPRFRRRD